MDFMARNNQQQGRMAPSSPSTPQQNMAHSGGHPEGGEHKDMTKRAFDAVPKWMRFINVFLLVSVTVLTLGVASFLWSYNPNEGKYLDTGNYQAVFLENGQVYFGKLKVITSKYYDLQGVFYLNTESSESTDKEQQNNFVLKKLGCEVHGPGDQMIINRDQVTFWENIKSDGQVSKAMDEWYKQNPDGQKCEETSNTTNQSASTTQNGTSTTTTNTNKQQ